VSRQPKLAQFRAKTSLKKDDTPFGLGNISASFDKGAKPVHRRRLSRDNATTNKLTTGTITVK
jgi:hypothetical protein